MSDTTPNLGLIRWNNTTDLYNTTELNANWDAIDAVPDNIRKIKILSTLPDGVTEPLYPGRLAMCTTTQNGVPPYTVMRYDGANWHVVGPLEQLPAVPVTGNVTGRLVFLTSASQGFPANTLISYTSEGWKRVGDISPSSAQCTLETRGSADQFVSSVGATPLNPGRRAWNSFDGWNYNSSWGLDLDPNYPAKSGLYLITLYVEFDVAGAGTIFETYLYKDNPYLGYFGVIARMRMPVAGSLTTPITLTTVEPLVAGDRVRAYVATTSVPSIAVKDWTFSLTRLGDFKNA